MGLVTLGMIALHGISHFGNDSAGISHLWLSDLSQEIRKTFYSKQQVAREIKESHLEATHKCQPLHICTSAHHTGHIPTHTLGTLGVIG